MTIEQNRDALRIAENRINYPARFFNMIAKASVLDEITIDVFDLKEETQVRVHLSVPTTRDSDDDEEYIFNFKSEDWELEIVEELLDEKMKKVEEFRQQMWLREETLKSLTPEQRKALGF